MSLPSSFLLSAMIVCDFTFEGLLMRYPINQISRFLRQNPAILPSVPIQTEIGLESEVEL